MDLVLKNARLPGRGDALADIAISSGKIAVIDQNIATGGPVIDAGGRLVAPGFIETHIHLDKSVSSIAVTRRAAILRRQ